MRDDLASASLLISSGITLIAAFLGLRQWYEWRARDAILTTATAATSFAKTCAGGSVWRSCSSSRQDFTLARAFPPRWRISQHDLRSRLAGDQRPDHRHAWLGHARLDLDSALCTPPASRRSHRSAGKSCANSSRQALHAVPSRNKSGNHMRNGLIDDASA